MFFMWMNGYALPHDSMFRVSMFWTWPEPHFPLLLQLPKLPRILWWTSFQPISSVCMVRDYLHNHKNMKDFTVHWEALLMPVALDSVYRELLSSHSFLPWPKLQEPFSFLLSPYTLKSPISKPQVSLINSHSLSSSLLPLLFPPPRSVPFYFFHSIMITYT